jgi:hypothetical protein
MPFDPNFPPTGAGLVSQDWRNQFNALKALIDAQVVMPIGGIIPWAKNSFGAALTLPAQFMECNGQAVNDAESPLDGETLPNLNGEGRFLRGAALSGDVGGADSHAHDVDLSGSSAGDPGASGGSTVPWGTYATTNASSLPPYYEVVWVMRIK